MQHLRDALHRSRPGVSALGILFLLIIILLFLFLFDMGYIFASQRCMDGESPVECAIGILLSDDEDDAEEATGGVTATGVISGTYKGKTRSIDLSITFPLEGGSVNGTFSGECDGTIKGTYAGGNGGAISGTAKGSCMFFLPASGTFSGTVNQTSKTVSVSGQGSAAGFSGEGSTSLAY